MARGVIFLGAPGCGKGTQAKAIVNSVQSGKICHLSTGDMLRAAVKAGTDIGKYAKSIMESGALVDDDIVIQLVADYLSSNDCKDGFILDGFPRTLTQAKMLTEMLSKNIHQVTAVINFVLDDKMVIKRISGRLVHAQSGRIYHEKYNPPKIAGIDDITGEPLKQRSDDSAEAIKQRLISFKQEIAPLLDYYESSKLLVNIDASKTAENLTKEIYKITEFSASVV